MTRGEIDHDEAAAQAADEDELIYAALQMSENPATGTDDLLCAVVSTNVVIARRLGRLLDVVDERIPGDL